MGMTMCYALQQLPHVGFYQCSIQTIINSITVQQLLQILIEVLEDEKQILVTVYYVQ